jgi:hypothetical protein
MSVVLANFVDGADVGMVQGRSRASLAPEALKSLRILRRVVGQEFESHKSAEKSVFRFVNHAHPTATEQFNDAVMGDSLADHDSGYQPAVGENPRGVEPS